MKSNILGLHKGGQIFEGVSIERTKSRLSPVLDPVWHFQILTHAACRLYLIKNVLLDNIISPPALRFNTYHTHKPEKNLLDIQASQIVPHRRNWRAVYIVPVKQHFANQCGENNVISNI